jgi:ubiquinone/menaquinone biosynthesis C-methylase UbiE
MMFDAADSVFADSIPEVYDEHLVPLIFEQYANDLARRARDLDPREVLEVAAGSGVVSRAVAAVLDASARYVVTDLSPPMLKRAESMEVDQGRIVWRRADAMDLPFDDDSFDLVLCQFGVMFFPDRVRAYREARRVLRGDGAFVFNMWDRIEENDFAFEVTRALADMFRHDPPTFLRRTPHGHYDTAIYRSELAAAGFEQVTVEPVGAVSTAPNPAIPAIAYCQGTPLRNEIEARNPLGLEESTARATDAIRERFGDRCLESRIRAFVITAR